MNFPGENLLSLTQETLHEILRDHFAKVFGGGVRVISTEVSGYYGSGGIKVTFTTDEKTDRELRREERKAAASTAMPSLPEHDDTNETERFDAALPTDTEAPL